MSDLSLCPICREKATKVCTACQSVAYCSKEHQKEHWKIHQKFCRPYKIRESPELGQHWVSVRDLEAGMILLDESPCMFIPQGHPSKNGDLFQSCLTCGTEMHAQDFRVCSKCSWPVCKEACEESSVHAENECKYFCTNRLSYQRVSSEDVPYWLLIIRCMELKERNPELYREFEELQHLQKIQQSPQRSLEHCRIVGGFIQSFSRILQDSEFGGKPWNEEDFFEFCDKLIRRSKINGFNIAVQENGSVLGSFQSYNVLCIFIRASRINHSCVPNCSWEIGPSPEFKIRIRTCNPIQKGKELAVGYFLREHLYGTNQRQKDVLNLGGFVCKCERCLDPTELGTYMSGVTCNSCKIDGSYNGYLLPVNPLDTSGSAVWQCEKCNQAKTASSFVENLNKIAGIMERKQDSFQASNPAESQQAADRKARKFQTLCENVIQKYTTHFLHPNHWIFQDAARGILMVYDSALKLERTLMNPDELATYIKHSKFLLSIHDKISPGLSANRSIHLRNTSQAILQRIMKSPPGQLSKEEVERELNECRQMQQEAIVYFRGTFPPTGASVSPTVQELLFEMRAANDELLRDLAVQEMQRVHQISD